MNKSLEKNFLESLLKDGSYSAQKAHDIIIGLNQSNDPLSTNHLVKIALAHYNKSFALMTNAKSFYFSNRAHLESKELEELFECFNLFSDEYLEAIEENSSVQYLNLYFDDYFTLVKVILG